MLSQRSIDIFDTQQKLSLLPMRLRERLIQQQLQFLKFRGNIDTVVFGFADKEWERGILSVISLTLSCSYPMSWLRIPEILDLGHQKKKKYKIQESEALFKTFMSIGIVCCFM